MSRAKGHDGEAVKSLERIENLEFAISTVRQDIKVLLVANKQERSDVVERLAKEIDKLLERATRASA
jgi:archaellum component FlaC